ncbi:hypothetical protein UlMin_025312 [Ulmus minor]
MEKFIIYSPSKKSPKPGNQSITPIPSTPITQTPSLELKSPKKELELVSYEKKKPIRGSTVWDHFTKIEGGDPKNRRCKCNYCGKDYAYDPKKVGTSSLWGHLNNQCKKNPYRVDEKKQKLKDDCRKSLARMVVLDELSFRFVEGEGFKNFVQTLQPKFVPPFRVTISRDIFRLFLDERSKLKKELVRDGQRICLTTDCWTSIQQINDLCLTIHYVDSE